MFRRVCVRRVVAVSCGVAGLAPASLKLCNSFARPQVTARVHREQVPTHLEATQPLCPQAIHCENIRAISMDF